MRGTTTIDRCVTAESAQGRAKPLTEKQARFLESLLGFAEREERFPTQDEMCAVAGVTHRPGIYHYLRELELKGYVQSCAGGRLRILRNTGGERVALRFVAVG